MQGLRAIFEPQSVAVVGASTTPGKVGHDIFHNILMGGFKGVIYPVNPSARAISGVRAYRGISEIPDDLDLAIIILPPKPAEAAVREAADKGVKGLVIVSAGFKEVGGEGVLIENRIVELCRERGVRLVGPNCLGVINPNPSFRLNASFSARMPAPGNISFISQSGALCTAVLDFAADRNFGFSKFISIGNKADVDELDVLRYLHEDIETEVIMMYLEALNRGPEFIEEVREITSGARRTPILAIKSGRTALGAKAAASHTGSLAGSEAVYDSIFKQSGIIRVDSINDLFDFANVFSYKHQSALGKITKKLPRGNRVAIVTNAGGPGIVATDVTVTSGLELAEFTEETLDHLTRSLPSTANIHNPVDIIGDAGQERYEQALGTVIKDENVDGAVVILTPQSMTNALGTAEAVVRVAQSSRKPIVSSFMGVVDVSAGVKYLQQHGYPVFRFPESAAKAFGVMYRYSKWVNREQPPEFNLEHDREAAARIIERCLSAGRTKLGELDGLDILKAYGFSVLPTVLAKTGDEAAYSAEDMGFPVVMKIVSDQIIHKSDAGGVQVNISSRDQAVQAFDKIIAGAEKYDPGAVLDGVLVQKMAPKGEEVILGLNRYPVFGPLIMFGCGGVFVEVFRDVAFRLAPLERYSVRSMIREIKGIKLLDGFRGSLPADLDALEKYLIALSDLAVNHPEIDEMDINPLMVHPRGQGATVADCRMILKPGVGRAQE